jgi:hypothetical protein
MAMLTDLKPGALDLNDLAWLEERYGQGLDVLDFSRMSVLRDILWLVARHEEPDVTVESVGARYTAASLMEEAGPVLRASGLMPADEGDEGNAPAAA